MIIPSFHLSISLNTNKVNNPNIKPPAPSNINVKQTYQFEEFPSEQLHLSESGVLKWEMSVDLLYRYCGYL